MKKITLFLNVILVSPTMLFCMQISNPEDQVVQKISGTLERINITRSQSKHKVRFDIPKNKPGALPVLDSKEGKKPRHKSRSRKRLTLHNNFHVVVDQELYRSAQLSPQALEAYIKQFGIKSVVSLRKKRNHAEETITSKLLASDKDYYHIPMSCRRLPSIESLERLLNIFKHAKKPMLVHCKKGIDRTSEAATLYLYAIKNKSKKEALQQLSRHFGYKVKIYPGKAFLIYLLPDNPETIPAWIKKTYNPYGYEWCKDILYQFEQDYMLGDLDPKAFLRDFKEGCDLGHVDLALADNVTQQARLQKEKESACETEPIFDNLYY